MKFLKTKFSAILLAILVLGSTTATALSFHLCGGEITDTALFSKAEGCGMHHHSPDHTKTVVSKKACCEDGTIKLTFPTSLLVEKQIQLQKTLIVPISLYVLDQSMELLNASNELTYPINAPPKILSKRYLVYELLLI